MSLLEAIVHNPVKVSVGILLVALFGGVALLRMPMLIVAALLNLVTFGQIPVLRVRSRMCAGLLSYYAGVVRTRSWLSPRALKNKIAKEHHEKTTQ